jgi:hypothetical protein
MNDRQADERRINKGQAADTVYRTVHCSSTRYMKAKLTTILHPILILIRDPPSAQFHSNPLPPPPTDPLSNPVLTPHASLIMPCFTIEGALPYRLAAQSPGTNPSTHNPFRRLYPKPRSFSGHRAHAPEFLSMTDIPSVAQQQINYRGRVQISHVPAPAPDAGIGLMTLPLMLKHTKLTRHHRQQQRYDTGSLGSAPMDLCSSSSGSDISEPPPVLVRPCNPLRLLGNSSSSDLSLARARAALQSSPSPCSSSSSSPYPPRPVQMPAPVKQREFPLRNGDAQQGRRRRSIAPSPLSLSPSPSSIWSADSDAGFEWMARRVSFDHPPTDVDGRKKRYAVSPHPYPKHTPKKNAETGQDATDIADEHIVLGPISPMPSSDDENKSEYEGVGQGEVHPEQPELGKRRVMLSKKMRERIWPGVLVRRGIVVEED